MSEGEPRIGEEFTADQLEAAIDFINAVPKFLSNPQEDRDLKSAFNDMCKQIGIPFGNERSLWDQANAELVARIDSPTAEQLEVLQSDLMDRVHEVKERSGKREE